jgi:hypothetical protein
MMSQDKNRFILKPLVEFLVSKGVHPNLISVFLF